MLVDKCIETDKEFIIDKLVEYNISKCQPKQEELFIDLSKKLIDNGKIIAGIIARMYCWNVVYIDTLWVDAEYRGQGIGCKLLKMIEQESKEKGADLVHLDTFDFQAKDFYEKYGYIIFGELKDCPNGHSRYFLKKVLK